MRHRGVAGEGGEGRCRRGSTALALVATLITAAPSSLRAAAGRLAFRTPSGRVATRTWMASAASTVTLSSVASLLGRPRSKYLMSSSR